MSGNPISPHLQVYRPQLTSVTSILHRLTGIFLSLGTVMLLYWLVAAALGPEAYARAARCFAAWPTQILMLAWAGAFYYHLLNGIRHLVMDTGRGLDLTTAYRTGYAVFGLTLVLTALTAACVVAQSGGAS